MLEVNQIEKYLRNNLLLSMIKEAKIEHSVEPWGNGSAKNITFILTSYCQLRCSYCYFVEKNRNQKMDFSTAKRTIDYILKETVLFLERSVIWEFIGGEPFLEIELLKLEKMIVHSHCQNFSKIPSPNKAKSYLTGS